MTVQRSIRWLVCVAAPALVLACGGGKKGGEAKVTTPANPLTQPNSAEMNQTAPDSFRVHFATSAGDFEIEVVRDWAPRGADRFYNLVKHGWYDGDRFFRVIPKFVVQFGLNGDPDIGKWWRNARIVDDSVKHSNVRGTITFAKADRNTRTTQVFISLQDNSRLDGDGFSPFGQVVSGMDVVDKITAQYGERPSQQDIQVRGNAYLNENFPKLDYIKAATVVQP
ncbi:MAG TPA: peptidylprolyl isomerase [Ramlibacter sp.]|nr:peptidylprolyl isomerase [Ramlibacter sp.]